MSREREGGRSGERVENINNNFKSSFAKNNSPPRSTIFVNNLPDKLDIFGFKGIFNKIGIVDDAIIPVVQRGRRRFGFIRFKNHESVNKSIQKFNNKVIRESKISVFEAKRDMVSKQINVTAKGGEEEFKKAELDAFERRDKKKEQRYQVSGPKIYSFGNKFDIFNNEDVSQKSCIKGQVNKERLKALLCSLVGETVLPVRVEFIWNKLKSENVGVVKVTAIQKNKFILEFGSEDEADLALTGSQILVDLFSKLKKWAWTDYSEKRFVWLEVLGIPPQGWSIENFRDIALKWGRLIGFDRNFEEADLMDSLKILILTNKMRSIIDDVILELENTSFRIWVEEVEEPELNQFYKSEDFDPKVADSSEEEDEEEGEFRKKEEGRVHKEYILSKPLSVVHEEDGDDSLDMVGDQIQVIDGAVEEHSNEETSSVDIESEKDEVSLAENTTNSKHASFMPNNLVALESDSFSVVKELNLEKDSAHKTPMKLNDKDDDIGVDTSKVDGGSEDIRMETIGVESIETPPTNIVCLNNESNGVVAGKNVGGTTLVELAEEEDRLFQEFDTNLDSNKLQAPHSLALEGEGPHTSLKILSGSEESLQFPPGFEPGEHRSSGTNFEPNLGAAIEEKRKKKSIALSKVSGVRCVLPQGRATNRFFVRGARSRQGSISTTNSLNNKAKEIKDPVRKGVSHHNNSGESIDKEAKEAVDLGSLLGLRPVDSDSEVGAMKRVSKSIKNHTTC